MLTIFLSGVSYGAIAILGNNLVVKISSSENRGLSNSLNNLAQSTAPRSLLLTTPLIELYSFIPISLIGGITALILIIPTFYLKKMKNKPPSLFLRYFYLLEYNLLQI